MKIAITGFNGFVGKAIVKEIEKYNKLKLVKIKSTEDNKIDSLNMVSRWGSLNQIANQLNDCDALIHLSGLAHKDDRQLSWSEYYFGNVFQTKELAKAAKKSGVKRIIYVSSLSVMEIEKDKIINHSSPAKPNSYYGFSKLLAERVVQSICEHSDMKSIIIRPPLIYGKNAPGNFKKLKKFTNSCNILPFGGINNKKSLIGERNFAEFIIHCLLSPKELHGTFLITDKETVSTTNLFRSIANSMNKNIYMLKVPNTFLKFMAFCFGQKEQMSKLLSSLEIDASRTFKLLNWQPKYTLDDQLNKKKEK